MNKKGMAKVRKDARVARKELFDIVGQCTVFLSKNGMPMDEIHEQLHEVVDESFDKTSIALETEDWR